MSKQAPRLQNRQTKQERRRERRAEQRRLEEERQRAMRLRRIVIGSVAVLVVLAAALTVYLYAFNRPASTARPAATPGQATSAPTVASAAVDNVPCDSNEHGTYHVHAYLSLFIKGEQVPVAQNIGITDTCLYWLHTHDSSGVIHVEAPEQRNFTLGNFLRVWGQKFPQLQYPSELNQTNGWQVYVDGKPYQGDFSSIPLTSHKIITLAYQSPGITPTTTVNWGDLTS